MTDRELLERAAKAAGLETRWDQPRGSKHGWLRAVIGGSWIVWDPLKDDGAALRLAIELGFNVYHAASSVFVEDLDSNVEIQQKHENDKFAATRRAIVRAAAEIGWEMS